MARGYKQNGNPFTSRGSSITPSSITPITTDISSSSALKQTTDPDEKMSVSEIIEARRKKMFEAQKQKNIEETGSPSAPGSRQPTAAEIIEARKQRLAAERGEDYSPYGVDRAVEEEVEEKPKVVGDPAQVAFKKSIKVYKPEEDEWTYIGGDRFTANKRRKHKEWETTGTSDRSVWLSNKDNIQNQYDSFEDFAKAAQEYRDNQFIEQNRSDWVKHWSKKDWNPYLQRKYGTMEDWIGDKIEVAGDTESARGWQEEFKKAKNQQEFLEWTETHAPNFWEEFTGFKRGGGTSGTTTGKGNWSGG